MLVYICLQRSNLSIYLSVCLSVYLSIYLSTYLPIYLSTYLSLSLSDSIYNYANTYTDNISIPHGHPQQTPPFPAPLSSTPRRSGGLRLFLRPDGVRHQLRQPRGLRAEQHLPVEARRGNHWFIGSRDLVICSHLVMAKMGWNDDWLVVWNMAELFSISYMGCHPSH